MDLMIINRLLDEIKELNAKMVEHEKSKKKDDPYGSKEQNELVASLAKAQGAYPVIKADRENPYFKSSYADLDMMIRPIRPILKENGLSYTQETRFSEDGATILHTQVHHSSGQWKESRARILPTKNTHQDYGSALSYAKRYQLQMILGITITQDPSDDDAEMAMAEARNIVAKGPSNKYNPKEQSHETITKEQIEELEYELAEAPDLAEMVLDKLQIQSLADMPKSKYFVSLQRIREIKLKRNGAK